MSEAQPVFLGVTNEAAAPRARLAWSMRQAGATYVEIGAGLGVTPARARQIVIRADLRMARACAIYDGPVVDPIAYGVWHVFDHDGRVTRGMKPAFGNPTRAIPALRPIGADDA